MNRKMIAALAVSASLAGCTMAGDQAGGSMAQGASAVPLLAADGSPRGTVRVSDASGGLLVRVEGANLPPGIHGAHVHAVGRCDAPDFTSAGPHWNPTSRQHGTQNPAGPHLGDAPNLTVAANGRGTLEFSVPGAMLRSGTTPALDADGAAFVIHANADDYRTDPSGNSGGRIACAVLR